jgi:hypothetical protein
LFQKFERGAISAPLFFMLKFLEQTAKYAVFFKANQRKLEIFRGFLLIWGKP